MTERSTPWLHVAAVLTLAVVSLPVATGEWTGGHDYYSYVWRAAEVRAQVVQGDLWPRWCPDFYWGHGYPFFVFYPPAVFVLSALISLLGPDLRWALLAVEVLGSGLLFYGTYRLARLYTRSPAAITGAAVATLGIYRFVQLYVRGDEAEALATGLVPWIVAEAVLVGRSRDRAAMLRLGGLVAAVSLTHTLTAVMTCGVLAVLGIARLVERGATERLQAFLRVGLASASGLVLAAAYWLPVLLLRPLVRTEQMTDRLPDGTSYWWADHFPTVMQRLWMPYEFGGSVPGPADGMSMATSPVGWLFVALAVVGVLAAKSPDARAMRPWVLALVAIQVMLLPISSPIWSVVPGLAWFQFPWRFLLLELVLVGLLAAWVAERIALDKAAWLLLLPVLAAAPTAIASYEHAASRPNPLDGRALDALTDPTVLLEFQATSPVPLTTAGRNEYLPRAVTRPPKGPPAPTDQYLLLEQAGAWRKYAVKAGGEVHLPWFDFPGVEVTIDGVPIEHTTDERGLIGVTAQPPAQIVEIRYGASTPERVGTMISAVAWIAWLLGWMALRRRP